MCGCITPKHPGGQGINSLESWPMNKMDRLSSPKSALFQLAQYILMNPLTRVRSSKGRDQLLFERWSWWTCCQCCKNRPTGIRPPLRKMLIWEDLSPTSWQVDRQMALLASNLSNYWPSFFLSYSSVWVSTAKHSTIYFHFMRVQMHPWLIYTAELYQIEVTRRHSGRGFNQRCSHSYLNCSAPLCCLPLFTAKRSTT